MHQELHVVVDRDECMDVFFFFFFFMHNLNLNAAAAVIKPLHQQFRIITCEYFEMKTKLILEKISGTLQPLPFCGTLG